MTTELQDLRGLELNTEDYVYGSANLGPLVQLWVGEVVPMMLRVNFLTPTNDSGSFGMTFTRPTTITELRRHWNDAAWLSAFSYISDLPGVRFALNGLCKLRPAARKGRDTLVLSDRDFTPRRVPNAAEVAKGDPLYFGDFPHPGAVIRSDDAETVAVGVSGFTGRQDHTLAAMTAEFLLGEMADIRTGRRR
jgi:hypothetical protein